MGGSLLNHRLAPGTQTAAHQSIVHVTIESVLHFECNIEIALKSKEYN